MRLLFFDQQLRRSKHWPLLYAVDMACDVVTHIEARDPQLANTLWGERRGCFEKPSKRVTPKVAMSNKYVCITYSVGVLVVLFCVTVIGNPCVRSESSSIQSSSYHTAEDSV